jgi:MFS family permease
MAERTLRFCIGGGCGIATVVTPLYLSETAPPLYKNRLGIANQSFIVLGVFLTQSLALFLSKPHIWRFVPLVSAAISLALLGSSIWVEESQVWIQSRRQVEPIRPDLDQEEQPLIRGKHCVGIYTKLSDLYNVLCFISCRSCEGKSYNDDQLGTLDYQQHTTPACS